MWMFSKNSEENFFPIIILYPDSWKRIKIKIDNRNNYTHIKSDADVYAIPRLDSHF